MATCDVTPALTLAGRHCVRPLPTALALEGGTPDELIASGAAEVGRVSKGGTRDTHFTIGGSSEGRTGYHCKEGRGNHGNTQHSQEDRFSLC